MAFDYSGLESVASTLVADFGQAATLRVVTHTPDPVKPWEQTDTNTDYAVTVVLEEFNAWERQTIDTIQVGDRKALVAAKDLTVAPAVDHLLLLGGVEFRVVAVETLDPGGTPLVYSLQVRK